MEIKKQCGKCKIEYPNTSKFFAKKSILTGKLESTCKSCRKISRKAHYLNNTEKSKEQDRERKNKTREWFYDIKSKLKCEVCSESRHWVLDFHHRNPEEKENSISFLMQANRKTKLLEEIKKCSVLCANCHRDLHYQDKTLGKNKQYENK